jgi:hypothetical protein
MLTCPQGQDGTVKRAYGPSTAPTDWPRSSLRKDEVGSRLRLLSHPYGCRTHHEKPPVCFSVTRLLDALSGGVKYKDDQDVFPCGQESGEIAITIQAGSESVGRLEILIHSRFLSQVSRIRLQHRSQGKIVGGMAE